jgi:hypothetical protein
MGGRRNLAFVLAVLAAGCGAILVLGEADRGCPDGYVTELDRALRGPRLAAALVAPGLGVALARGGRTPRGMVSLGLALGAVVLVGWLALPAIGAALGFADGGGG